MTQGGDHVTSLVAEHVEEKVVNLIAFKRTKKNLQKWIVKNRGSQVGEFDQLKLETVLLHDDLDKEIHMTQSIGFVPADLISVND